MRKRKLKTPFTDMFGNNPRVKVLQTFLMWSKYDLTMSAIIRDAEVSSDSAYLVVNSLLKDKLIVKTRIVGKSQYYQMNMKSATMHTLLNVYEVLP